MKFNLVFKSSRSFTFELDNKDIYFNKEKFDVLVNGKVELSGINTNVFSIYNLDSNTEYAITVGKTTEKFTTDYESSVVNVRDFGAIGDGVTEDTLAIQSAILSVLENGRVLIPEGTYLVRPLFLRSNITIEIVKGATLLGETDRYKYPVLPGQIKNNDGSTFELASWEGTPDATYASIITGVSVSNVKVIGEGIIDANAQNSDWWVDVKNKRGQWRPKGVFLSNCNHIGFQGVTVKNTPSWNLHPYFSNYIDFIDMKLMSPKDSHNTDGCDPESCDYVNVIGVNFSVGDDCIAIKSGKYEMGMKYRKPTSHMTVRNCFMNHGHGAVVLGSEMSGGITDLSVSQCYFYKTDRGLRIKTRRGRGESAIIDGITFENIYMDGVLTPLVMNMYYYCDPDGKTEYVWSKEALKVDERTPYLGKFVFKDMKCINAHAAAAFFYGLPEQPIKSITIENVDISFAEDAKPARPAMMSFQEEQLKAGLQFRYVDHVELKNVNVSGVDTDNYEPIVLENVKEFIQK
ncbi:Glycoside hydrolase family 28 [Alteracholeplasma palmae J233]|uniref:Glycoside hydrolase family 28 n=1 Tax=Alteracholeplasma palmae (strain ATCC 49389 / J233) TaxID=1318466 RepID=U4KKG5_ALTPJ|nr:glycoside hydrolase family 28 protein [Alteracholeplasma palmae]CCV64097.1 Glycoside hydrolase family 28 [Alteracholeplasma palmae J233]